MNVLCMAPTEYRVIAKRATLRPLPHLRGMVAAGEALNPEVLRAWREVTGLEIRDGYGQTETGQLTGSPTGERATRRARWAGRCRGAADDRGRRAGRRTRRRVPTFFLGYLGEGAQREADGGWTIADRREQGPWHTGDRVREDEDGYLYFEGRADDVIVSAGYRIGPFEVESALVAHPAVAEAAAVAAPDEERGAVVRAVVVLRDGAYAPSPELARELQEHVKRETAPYKYPRIVEFAPELPKTASGKVRRALLRREAPQSRRRRLESAPGRGDQTGLRRLLRGAVAGPHAALQASPRAIAWLSAEPSPTATIASISTGAPSAARETPTVTRAGAGVPVEERSRRPR